MSRTEGQAQAGRRDGGQRAAGGRHGVGQVRARAGDRHDRARARPPMTTPTATTGVGGSGVVKHSAGWQLLPSEPARTVPPRGAVTVGLVAVEAVAAISRSPGRAPLDRSPARTPRLGVLSHCAAVPAAEEVRSPTHRARWTTDGRSRAWPTLSVSFTQRLAGRGIGVPGRQPPSVLPPREIREMCACRRATAAPTASSTAGATTASATETTAAGRSNLVLNGHDVTLGGQPVKGGVERAGGQVHPPTGQFVGPLDDGVTVQWLVLATRSG
jgi:hypothetical protein